MKSNKNLLLSILFVAILVALPGVSFAKDYTVNGRITKKTGSTIVIESYWGEMSPDDPETEDIDESIWNYSVDIPSSSNLKKNDYINFKVTNASMPGDSDYTTTNYGTVVISSIKKGTDVNADIGWGGKSDTAKTRLFLTTGCNDDEKLVCWLREVYKWSQRSLLVAAVAAIVIAGIMYMTSMGNQETIKHAKKIITGALTGVAVIVLGKFFLEVVIGVPWVL